MKAKILTNPYIVYVYGFLFVLLVYSLRWSYLYPPLSIGLIFFLLITMVVSLLLGIIFHRWNYLSYNSIHYPMWKIAWVSWIIFAAYLPEFAYARALPILSILSGADYDYVLFGIPTYHVILVTFNSFWAVFIFHCALSIKKKALYLYYVICLIPSILIFNRGMFLLILSASLFVYFMSVKNVRSILIKVGIFIFGILFVFGLAGNARSSKGDSANELILELGEATPGFTSSVIPDEFFWTYLYVSSPLANTQETMNGHAISSFSVDKSLDFVNDVFVPDFISKHLRDPLNVRRERYNQVAPWLTVGGVYAMSYAYFGWVGMCIMFMFMMLFNFIVIIVLRKRSIFFVTGIAILNCIMFFDIYDNMYIFSGLVMQLFYPVLFGLFGGMGKDKTGNQSLQLS